MYLPMCNHSVVGLAIVFAVPSSMDVKSDSFFDVQCCSILEALIHKGHQHCLLLGTFFQPECNACGRLPRGAQTFNCTTCGFRLCIKCATLPFVTRHRYDKHLLYLTYAAEDDSGEYYCQICKKERAQKALVLLL
ncbi:hypothetical protein SLA2020_474750 [Shorea laevis]